MKLFGFLPECVLERIRAAALPISVPSLARSLIVGSAGFSAVSLVVFGLWAFTGRATYRMLGEAGAYGVWALVFILLAGAALNPIIIGPGSLGRFARLFAISFAAYAICWMAAWFGLRGRTGEWAGALAGTAAMGVLLAGAFGAWRAAGRVIVVLFITNAAGYFVGGYLFDFFRGEDGARMFGTALNRSARVATGQLLWGAAFGLGFGAGLGYALHACQEGIRERLLSLQGETPIPLIDTNGTKPAGERPAT